jgi:coniferyl-aldehyde dehydrogenase
LVATLPGEAKPIEGMRAVLERQRGAFTAEMPVSCVIRKDRLQRALDLILEHKGALVKAVSADFGHRSADGSLVTDILASVKPLKHAIRHVDGWMRPEKRPLDFPLGLLGARAHVEFQPKGVVGVISPWNFPVSLTFAPLANIFAAGNRAMVKPSEFTPRTSDLMAELAAKYFDESELAFVIGGPEVGKAFAGLAFDHLFFTGATPIAKHILHAAADNLVPVTLELGGKSANIVLADADMDAALRGAISSTFRNQGEICTAGARLIVERPIAASLVERLSAHVIARNRNQKWIREMHIGVAYVRRKIVAKSQCQVEPIEPMGGKLREITAPESPIIEPGFIFDLAGK